MRRITWGRKATLEEWGAELAGKLDGKAEDWSDLGRTQKTSVGKKAGSISGPTISFSARGAYLGAACEATLLYKNRKLWAYRMADVLRKVHRRGNVCAAIRGKKV